MRLAVIISLIFLLVAGFSAYEFYNDLVVLQYCLVGSFLPVVIYGSLILFVLTINPLLRRFHKSLALKGHEVALGVAIILSMAFVPSNGLGNHFTFLLMMPHHFERIRPDFQEQKILEYLPSAMLADITRDPDRVLDGFVMSLGKHIGHIGLDEVPWFAWVRTLSFWIPTLLAFIAILTGIGLVVHRQWSEHEQIPYPIAQFVQTLLPKSDGSCASILANRWFLFGLLLVFGIHSNNYLAMLSPSKMISIPRILDFSALNDIFPVFVKGGGGYLFTPRIYFSALGFAYLISAEVSISVGIAPAVYALFTGIMLKYGIDFTGRHSFKAGLSGFVTFGACIGFFLGMLYTGRRHYTDIMRRGLFLKSADHKVDTVRPYEAWGFRVMLAGAAMFVALMTSIGLDWQIAFLYTLFGIIMFIVLGRVVAETGVFLLNTPFMPGVILLGILGERAMGPINILILFFFGSTLMIAARESFFPFFLHALRLVDLRDTDSADSSPKPHIGRTAMLAFCAVAFSMCVAIPAAIYWPYDQGAKAIAGDWNHTVLPTWGLEEAGAVMGRLHAQGAFDASIAMTGWQRLAGMAPHRPEMLCFFITLGLVVLLSAARFRYPRLALHPVFFIVMANSLAFTVAADFLIGGIIKALVLYFGGVVMYRRTKPFVLGLIAGEMLAGVVMAVGSGLYHLYFGVSLPTYPLGG